MLFSCEQIPLARAQLRAGLRFVICDFAARRLALVAARGCSRIWGFLLGSPAKISAVGLVQAPEAQEEALFRGAHQPVGRKQFLHRLVSREGRMTAAHRGLPTAEKSIKGFIGVNSRRNMMIRTGQVWVRTPRARIGHRWESRKASRRAIRELPGASRRSQVAKGTGGCVRRSGLEGGFLWTRLRGGRR
jgi:hypothetical protein